MAGFVARVLTLTGRLAPRAPVPLDLPTQPTALQLGRAGAGGQLTVTNDAGTTTLTVHGGEPDDRAQHDDSSGGSAVAVADGDGRVVFVVSGQEGAARFVDPAGQLTGVWYQDSMLLGTGSGEATPDGDPWTGDNGQANLSVGGTVRAGQVYLNRPGTDPVTPDTTVHLDGGTGRATVVQLESQLVRSHVVQVTNAGGTGGLIQMIDAAGAAGVTISSSDITLPNGDIAEQFDFPPDDLPPAGSVVVLTSDRRAERSTVPYDRRVGGVVAGAGRYRPALVLDDDPGSDCRLAVSCVGKAYVWVDAGWGPVAVGDPLTTSATPGHAMRAEPGDRSFGAVLGKALQPLDRGRALVPALITLR